MRRFSKVRFGMMVTIMLVFGVLYNFVYANSLSKNITIDDAIDRALSSTREITEMDKTIDDMWKQRNELFEMSRSVQSALDDMENYKRLFESRQCGNSLNLLEIQQLTMYNYIYGSIPSSISPADMFHKYIKNRDFPHYSMAISVENMKQLQKLTIANVESGVRKLFSSYFGLNDMIVLQGELYSYMKDQHEKLAIQYKVGLSSEVDIFTSNINLRKQQLEINKLKRNMDNILMALKKQIGMPLNDNIILLQDQHDRRKQIIFPYKDCLKEALSNRYEVITAKNDLHVKQRELDIMQEYIKDETSTELMETRYAVDEKMLDYNEAILIVTEDIYTAYNDIVRKNIDISTAEKKKENAIKQYDRTKLLYEKGLINQSFLKNAEINCTQTKIAYIGTLRSYNDALYNLNMACSIGPGYTSGSGGY